MNDTPIAIVGIGGVFPRSKDLDHFWRHLAGGVDTASDVPAGRWILPSDVAHDPRMGVPDRVYSTRGCFVDDFALNMEHLDLEPGFAAALDPMFHFALHACRDAWRDARMEGTDPLRVGVILGNIALPTEISSAMSRRWWAQAFTEQLGIEEHEPPSDVSPINRHAAGMPAGLAARALGLGGGSCTLDAACASSLYALKLAMLALESGRADAMLAGGLSRPDCLYTQMGFSQLRALSPTGTCSPFSDRADGLVVGEGAGVFVLKRLADALAHTDHIYAVIRGIALSNDTDGSLLAPSSQGQLRAMREAYAQAGWRPSDIDLVECHATGTPVGDAVEFQSLCTLWDNEDHTPGQCVIGSVKSNVGHLLTGAGAAGLMKVLLSMQHGRLPPTANFGGPGHRIRLSGSPFRILRESEPWRRRQEGCPRKAAVSAFGFGGINAHVLLEEYLPGRAGRHPFATRAMPCAQRIDGDIAIVGMDVWYGGAGDMATFRDAVLWHREGTPEPPRDWRGLETQRWMESTGHPRRAWRGFRVGGLAVRPGRFRIPPTELREMLPQQLLMLLVTAGALEDAGLTKADHLRSGVFVGIALDLETTQFSFRWSLAGEAASWAERLGMDPAACDLATWISRLRDAAGPPLTANRTMGSLGGIVASRIAREFQIGGPSFTVSSEDSSGFHAIEKAVRSLQHGDVDLAVAGAVDLPGDMRTMLASHAIRPYSRSGQCRPFDARADGTVVGEGAACLILKRLEDAQGDGDRIYAVIKGIGNATGGKAEDVVADAHTYRKALRRALEDAQVPAHTLGYLETHGSGDPREDRMEMEALQVLAGRQPRHACVLGYCKDLLGHSGAASFPASLVKTVLCLYHAVLPAAQGRRHLVHDRHARATAVFPAGPRPWLRNRSQGPRRAGVVCMSVDGNCGCLVLEAHEDATARLAPGAAVMPEETLFVIASDDVKGLQTALGRLEADACDPSMDVRLLARRWWRRQTNPQHKRLAMTLLCGTRDALRTCIARGRQHLALHPDRPLPGDDGPGTGDASAGRIFYQPSPLGPDAEIALVFPGSGNQFEDMGRILPLYWPRILERQDRENGNLLDQYRPDLFWTSGEEGRTRTISCRDMILGQVALGTMMSDLLATFGIRPGAAIGYSLGEAAALFALRAWRNRDAMLARIEDSSLFTDELAGRFLAARRYWRYRNDEAFAWAVGVVNRTAAEVRDALATESKVYLAIVNTPDECVLCGEEKALQRVVAGLGARFLPLHGVASVHCPVVGTVQKEYRALHLLDVTPPDGIRFYSAAWGRSYPLTAERAADSILAQALEGLDFPALIHRAYQDGVRIFLETGPGGSCTRMISRILGAKPHLAVAACAAQRGQEQSFFQTLARLIADRVRIDLHVLYDVFVPLEHASAAAEAKHQRMIPASDAGSLAVPRPKRLAGDAAHQSLRDETVHAADADTAPRTHDACDGAAFAVDATVTGSPPVTTMEKLVRGIGDTDAACAVAQQAFLDFSRMAAGNVARNMHWQARLLAQLGEDAARRPPRDPDGVGTPSADKAALRLNRKQCLRFATGKISEVLGEAYRDVDDHPTRVRLPDEPLMLVDRILEVEGEAKSMTGGRVVSEHDILQGAWYLDGNRIPTCMAVEAGQADLFLSGYLGIDFHTMGRAVYRLLDARICFHRSLPGPGKVIRYDIRIDRFFRQGRTHLFHFHFEGSIDGEPFLSMTHGCAGFFDEQALASGRGIVRPALDMRPGQGRLPHDWKSLVPMQVESYSGDQLQRLREGDLQACFGTSFQDLPLAHPIRLPDGRMKLVSRVDRLDPHGGRYGLGLIRAQADIHPDDWFLTCHFVDDPVMPGTLMYECCLHTLRIYLMRMGWVAEEDRAVFEPVPHVESRLKCRGQVTARTRKVMYEVVIKELGYDKTPYALADALMYADGKPIVEITNMSLRLQGATRREIESLWSRQAPVCHDRQPPVFDHARIMAFAVGRPSEAFGEPYRVFDQDRVIARLPGPPYQFLDRITKIRARAWRMQAGGVITAQYDVPRDAWYFSSERQDRMPLSVLLEVALQPCGWLAAYMGSALTSDVDLSFRNLGGRAVQMLPVDPSAGTLSTVVKVTKVSQSAGMIIQHYDFEVSRRGKTVYKGNTYFGFFSKQALANQIGIRDAVRYRPTQPSHPESLPYPNHAPYPDATLAMIDRISHFSLDGGPHGLGFLQGRKSVNPDAWFFKAHFYQDPVWPGSLGLESLQQLLKIYCVRRWDAGAAARFESPALGEALTWTYRGQVLPQDREVTVDAMIKHVEDARGIVKSDGLLLVDGRMIYQMHDFTLRLLPS